MNYIEAHQIVHEYFNIVSSKKNEPYGIPYSALPFSSAHWQDDLIGAYKLYCAHAILWQDLSTDEYQSAEALLFMDNQFVSDRDAECLGNYWEEIERSKRSKLYTKMHSKRIKIATDAFIALKKPLEPYNRNDEVSDFCNHMTIYRRENAYPEYHNKHESIEDVVFNYCIETYKVANLNYEYGNDICFYTFKQMRTWISEAHYVEILSKYKPYLFMWDH